MKTRSVQRVVLATRNRGKQAEFQTLLGDRFEIVTLEDLDISSPPEDAQTFVENALIKARHASALSGMPAIADDSGLCVEVLNGAPGIHSARYAGEEANDTDNNEKLLQELRDVPEQERGARFHCTLVYLRHAEDPEPLVSQGVWQGKILFEPKGENGFGYDPLFYVPETNCSSAALTKEEKNQISHRAIATKKLVQLLEELI